MFDISVDWPTITKIPANIYLFTCAMVAVNPVPFPCKSQTLVLVNVA